MGPLPMLAPPAPIRVLLTWEPASPRDLHRIREGLARQFAGRAELRERMELVATELTGNALRHGSPPVVVRLLETEANYVVDVTDCAVDRAPESAGAHPDARAGGRGLHIVRSLADHAGWYATDDRKHVWASLSR